MLGWHISIYRQQNEGTQPASYRADHGTRLAVWQTGVSGLDWLDALVKESKAIQLARNGYPTEYTAMAKDIVEHLRGDPPHANVAWTCGPDDVIMPGWAGKTVKDGPAIDACRPDEWLIVQAWDES